MCIRDRSFTWEKKWKRQREYEVNNRKCDIGEQFNSGAHGRSYRPAISSALQGTGVRTGLYGDGAVSYTHLDVYKRQDQYTEFLGNRVVCHSIPIRPGRNLAIIVESAAVNYRQKKMGYNAAQELYKRVPVSYTHLIAQKGTPI